MQIESTRFGTIDIRDDAVITFPDGLIGLPGTRYALIAQSDETAFYWLHSVDDPAIALPVTNPWLFFGDYEVRVADEDAGKLDLATGRAGGHLLRRPRGRAPRGLHRQPSRPAGRARGGEGRPPGDQRRRRL